MISFTFAIVSLFLRHCASPHSQWAGLNPKKENYALLMPTWAWLPRTKYMSNYIDVDTAGNGNGEMFAKIPGCGLRGDGEVFSEPYPLAGRQHTNIKTWGIAAIIAGIVLSIT